MRVPGTSQTHNGVDTDGSDFQDTFEDSFDSSHVDRPTTDSISGAWTHQGDAGRGKAANDIQPFSAWTRYGEPRRERPVDDPQLVSGGSGWWKEQMLVDRSLRTMAGLTSMFALIMMILSIRYLPDLLASKNETSTSVGSQTGQDCGSLETTNVVSSKCSL